MHGIPGYDPKRPDRVRSRQFAFSALVLAVISLLAILIVAGALFAARKDFNFSKPAPPLAPVQLPPDVR